MSFDRKNILFRSGNSWKIVSTKSAPKKPNSLKMGIKLKVNPKAEYHQIFKEGWRFMRDFLYVDNTHGAPWDKIYQWYSPWINHVRHRTDLNYVVDIMSGEVAVGHSYVSGGDMPDLNSVSVGLLGCDFEIDQNHYKISKITKKYFTLKFFKKEIIFNKPTLDGQHQLENVSTALATILKLKILGYPFFYQNINQGIIKTTWPGRLERCKLKKINVFLDGAHNIDGAQKLLEFFRNQNLKVWLIIGMLNNKDLYGFIKKLKPILSGVIALKIPNEKNSFTTKEIKQVVTKLNISCTEKKSIIQANDFLLNNIKPKTLLISGSLYLIGKIRKQYL